MKTYVPIGLFVPCATPVATSRYVRALGPGAECRGFESVWVAEHVVSFDRPGREQLVDSGVGTMDPFVLLSFLAACTTTLRLGTGVTLISQRQPLFLAKEAASIDWLSDGRLELGVGLGWIRGEFDALGLRREDRGRLADRNLELLLTLWRDEVSELHRADYELPPCRAYPKPVQLPQPPVHVGGSSSAALRRVARSGQGWYAFDLSPDQLRERLVDLDGALDAVGRTRADVVISVCPYREAPSPSLVAAYAAAGADRVIVMAGGADEAELERTLDRLQPLTEVLLDAA